MIECAVEIDGRFAYAMRADGIIVSTPTGSTAYALSAGGPILDPRIAAIALVPVAPHALTHRPIALSDLATISIQVVRGSDATVHCDGHAHFPLGEGDRVVIGARGSAPLPAPGGARPLRDAAGEAALERNPRAARAARGLMRLNRVAPPMLRCLAIRDFVVVSALELELEPGFTVLTGETGAGKSILLDALGLLLGDRFEPRQMRAGAERAELAAAFDVDDAPAVRAWLVEEGIAESDGEVLLRRVLDAQGTSRAWINGSPATLAQLKALGERLVEITGQHAHQALSTRRRSARWSTRSAASRRSGARPSAWRAWRAAQESRDAAAGRRGDGRGARVPRGATPRARDAGDARRRMGGAVGRAVAARERRDTDRAPASRRPRALEERTTRSRAASRNSPPA